MIKQLKWKNISLVRLLIQNFLYILFSIQNPPFPLFPTTNPYYLPVYNFHLTANSHTQHTAPSVSSNQPGLLWSLFIFPGTHSHASLSLNSTLNSIQGSV